MLNVLKSDLYKLFRSRALYICLLAAVLFILIVPFSLEALQNMMKTMSPEDMAIIEQTSESGVQGMNVGLSSTTLLSEEPLSGQWYLGNVYSGNTLLLVLVIFISIFVSAEFSHGTIKNIASKGVSRSKIYLSKLLTVMIVTAIFSLVLAAVGTLAASCMWGFGPVSGEVIWQCIRLVLMQTLLHIALVSFFMMICFIMKNSGAAISINICSMMFIPTIFALIDKLLKKDAWISNIWPATYINSLVTLTPEMSLLIKALAIALIYIVVSSALGMFVFHKKDIA